VFDKYYSKTDTTPLYAAALVLDPTCRTEYIKTNWPSKWQRPILRKVESLWESYRDQAPIPIVPTSYYSVGKEKERELTVFDQIAQDLRKYSRPASQDEFQEYCNGDPYDIGEITALDWWAQEQQRKRWPRLSYMALDILSIPAMSAEPERVFSGARRTVSWERAQIGPETLERVECLKHWKKSGILDQILRKEDLEP
jgi:hypothetical protein